MNMLKKIGLSVHDLFIPSERNNYRAKTLHIASFTLYIIVLLTAIVTYKTVFAVITHGEVLGIATDITVDELFNATNKEREKAGLPRLGYNTQLEKAAQDKARNMFQYRYWAHYSPDGSTPWDFILASGYKYEYAGENLAKDFMFSDGVVSAWMSSPAHKDNILRSQYTDMGLAVVNGTIQGAPTTLVVQMFGTPLKDAVDHAPRMLALRFGGLAGSNTSSSHIIIPPSIKKISFNYSIWFLSFLIFVLIIDFYCAYKLRLIRLTGKHIAHSIFLVIIIAAFIVAAKGVIL